MSRHIALASRPGKAPRGFTLIELLVVMAIAAVLACIAYPSLAGSVRKMRRCEALLALMQLQQAQEHWRSNHSRYAALSELGMPARTPDGRYTLSIASPSASGYAALAVASGAQAGDAACAYLRVDVSGGSLSYHSGRTVKVDNAQRVNRRCWNQ